MTLQMDDSGDRETFVILSQLFIDTTLNVTRNEDFTAIFKKKHLIR
jgi:hypothetical protein